MESEKTKGSKAVPFRVCIIEDQALFRKSAEASIKEIFQAGHYGRVLSLIVDAPATYQKLIKECTDKLQSGYYNAVLVDNELSSYPDYSEIDNPIAGIELIVAIVKRSRPKTAFILNSSSNIRFLEINPKLLEIFASIPKAGKNSDEAFQKISELMQAESF
jgi:hypothetical protein